LHTPGVPTIQAHWFDCTPAGTINAIQAYVAARSARRVPFFFTTCGADQVVVGPGTDVLTWAYAGPDAGHVSDTPGPTPTCPTTADNAWG
jgi:hypothetical protein